MMAGSSIESFVRIEESDQYLYPDLESFAIMPWRSQYGDVARLICDVYNPNGKPTTTTNDQAGYFDLGTLDQGEGPR